MYFYEGREKMYQAKWKDRTFSISSKTIIKTLQELSTSYKVKKATIEWIYIPLAKN